MKYEGDSRVKVITFDGAAVDLLESEDTVFYVRGIRDCADLEYENRDRFASLKLKSDMVTVYLPSDKQNIEVRVPLS